MLIRVYICTGDSVAVISEVTRFLLFPRFLMMQLQVYITFLFFEMMFS